MTKIVINNEDRNNYGIVYTPNNLINNILNLIPNHFFSDPNLKWLDIGAGTGCFSINLYNRLYNELSSNIIDNIERKKHIIENMLYMVEIYPPHITILEEHFTKKANIINMDFLAFNIENYCKTKFDFVIGNPPYNINGQLKTPTNKKIKKTDDGKQIYVEFIKKSLEILKPNGYLNIIIPSLWLKPDKSGLYNILTNKKIHKLVCLSTNETQKAFNYKAQTPTCYFLIENMNKSTSNFNIFDNFNYKFINYNLYSNYPIPTNGINIINNLLFYVNNVGYLKIYKSSTPSKYSIFENDGENYKYKNIKTTLLSNNIPNLVINYSNIIQQYYNKPKLILANKMYGFPYYDISGIYGISSRDNYIILEEDYSKNELEIIQSFLSTKTALFIFSTTNYRMRYLEKYAFQFIPNISKIIDFPNLLNKKTNEKDELLANFFGFSQIERETIQNNFKDYNFFI